MKKLFLTLCSVLLILSSMLIAFTGCNHGNDEDAAIDGENTATNENGEDTVTVRGEFCVLEVAYENGWLSEADLKSIACCYIEFYRPDYLVFEKENPYVGLYQQPTEALSKSVENELKQAYLNQIANYPEGSLDNVQLNYYYGTYSGNILVRISSDYICIDPMILDEYYIGNVVFENYWDAQTWVYHIADIKELKNQIEQLKQELAEISEILMEIAESSTDGTFYTLQEAYDNDWLTQTDLMNVAYWHNGGREYNEELMAETSFEPLPITPEALSRFTELKIKSIAAKEYREKYHFNDSQANDFRITDYCGTYGECIAIKMGNVHLGTGDVEWTDSVAGVNFYYSNGRSIQIWKE